MPAVRTMETTEAGDKGSSFGREMRQRILEDFVVAYYNGSLKPNLAEKDPMTGKDVEFLMDGPQFDKIKKSEIWSHSTAIGSGYQYKVVYKDKRFSGLGQLLGAYTGSLAVAEEDKSAVEQGLYEVVLLLIKEGRLPQSFKIHPVKDARVEKLNDTVERLTQALDTLEKRVKSLEDAYPVQATPADPKPSANGGSDPGLPDVPNDLVTATKRSNSLWT